ncbi:DUF6193 family natural product biosynthesis protein [Streptomyces sp. NBC_01579]|uniref:DUF6193 family natural product biosynthesis protein n=1 Tax=Streptomyces sp. NBC_01579 TaxID=2975885 RepID=UPI003868BCEC
MPPEWPVLLGGSYLTEVADAVPVKQCLISEEGERRPSIFPHGERHFRVLPLHEPRGSGREQIGDAVTADEAVELVASHLPPGCGPALDGMPDDLESLS